METKQRQSTKDGMIYGNAKVFDSSNFYCNPNKSDNVKAFDNFCEHQDNGLRFLSTYQR